MVYVTPEIKYAYVHNLLGMAFEKHDPSSSDTPIITRSGLSLVLALFTISNGLPG